jgi:hypothetical protein
MARISSVVRNLCIVTMTALLSLLLPVAYLPTAHSALAQDRSANSTSTPKALAGTLLDQIEAALKTMKQEFGPTVFTDGQGELHSAAHGDETIGNAWDRNLVAAGVPKDLSQRKALARSIGLDPQASLVLAGVARMDGIEYLLSQLRHISQDP